MRRRDFIKGIAGSTAVWPFAARAQQAERTRRIGVLSGLTADDPQGQATISAFLQSLQQLGWADGRNATIDYRWGAGNVDDMRKQAAELVALGPDVMVATGGASVGPLLQATRTIPIVFANVPDPVGSGFIESLSRPGGNATGFVQFEYNLTGKWLELLKQVAPNVTNAVMLWDPTILAGIGQFAVIQSVAPSLGVEVHDPWWRRGGPSGSLWRLSSAARPPPQSGIRGCADCDWAAVWGRLFGLRWLA